MRFDKTRVTPIPKIVAFLYKNVSEEIRTISERVVPHSYTIIDACTHLYKKPAQSEGMCRLHAFRGYLSKMDISFSIAQEKFIDTIESAIVSMFFENDIAHYAEKLMRDNKWTSLSSFVLGMMGRRCGKTAVVTACIVAFLLATPNSTVYIVTIIKSLGFHIMAQVFLCLHYLGLDGYIYAFNANELSMIGYTATTDVRSIHIASSTNVSVCTLFFVFCFFT